MRIDKFICDTINITRTQAKNIISRGLVLVDGKRVRSGSEQVDLNDSTVTVDGKELSYIKYVYIMMNKPAGVLSASTDKRSKTAFDLLDPKDRRHDLFIAGRLDRNSTGFLLITNDGEFAHNALSPKKHIFKTYVVELEHPVTYEYGQAFANGIILSDGYKCKSAEYKQLDDFSCIVKISEGKFHQIKRMFEALENRVVHLHRIAMDDLKLDPVLNFGEYRYLTAEEIDFFVCKINKKSSKTIGRASK